jgi:peptidoglycan/xylan/chitin deacetylase (PgdA/CDA1 family)
MHSWQHVGPSAQATPEQQQEDVRALHAELAALVKQRLPQVRVCV